MTFNRLNQTEFKRAYEYFRDEIKPDDIVINLVRGEPRKPTTAEVDLELYRQAVEQKMSDVRRGRIRYYQFGLMGRLAAARDGLMYQQILNYKQGKAKYLPCLAGRLSAVINEEGRVYACELLTKAVGDLRKYNYDFKKLWQSPKAAKLRNWIWQTKCSCTHECFLTTNIFFSPQVYPELLIELLRLYAKR
jgi:radical SAM protein with 4Fe4S-binding SPASM domain